MDYIPQNNPKPSQGHSLSHQFPVGHPWSCFIPSSFSDVSSSSFKKKINPVALGNVHSTNIAAIRGVTAAWDSWERKWRIYLAVCKSNCFLFQGASRHQWLVWGAELLGIGYMIWYMIGYMRPHHMHTMPSSFTACFCLLLSSKSERIEAIALYSLADGRAASTLLFLCIVSLLLKPHVRAFLLPFLLSPTGDQGSFPSSLPRLATTSSLHHTLCSGWWEAEPAFRFCHLHWGKPVFLCSWGPWGGEAKFTSWFSAEMPRHSHTALAAGTVLTALSLL